MRMREKGLKETGCNAAIRAINAISIGIVEQSGSAGQDVITRGSNH